MATPAAPFLSSRSFPGLRIRVHADLEALAGAWKALAAEADCYVFQTWEWNHAWYRCVGRPRGVSPRVVVVQDETGVVLAIWPLCIYRRKGLRILAFMGDVVSDYRAPLLSATWLDQADPSALDALGLECLGTVRGADIVLLDRMPARFARHDNPMARLPGACVSEHAYSAALPDSAQKYLHDRSSQMMSGLRRKARRLAEQGDVRFTPLHDAREQDDVFRALARQKSRRWRESGSRDLFAESGYLDFYRSLGSERPGDGFVALSSLRVSGTVVASHWGLVFRDRFYWILPGYEDGQWSRYSCGQLLLQDVIVWAVDRGLSCFDLTVGDEAYKKGWSTDNLPLYRWRCARTLPGWAYLALGRVYERARATPWLRQCVRSVRAFFHRRE